MTYKNSFLLLLVVVLLAACNTSPNVNASQTKPEDAAKAFFEALSALDFEKAQALGDDLTKKQVSYLAAELRMSSEAELAEKKKGLELQFKSVNCAENQGKMICKVCCTSDGAEAEAELVQKDNKWFVHLDLNYDDTSK